MKFLSKILLIMAICEEQVFGISPEQAAAIARLKGLMARLNQAKESFSSVKIFSSSFRFDCISDFMCTAHFARWSNSEEVMRNAIEIVRFFQNWTNIKKEVTEKL